MSTKTPPMLTSFAADSRVRTSLARAEALALAVRKAGYGTNSFELLRACALDGLSSKTSPQGPKDGLMPSEETWNGPVMRRFRSLFRQTIAALPIVEHAFSSSLAGLLPTTSKNQPQKCRTALLPTATATAYGYNQGGANGRTGPKRGSLRTILPTLPTKGNHNCAGASPSSGDGLATVIGGPLNPRWLEWFMGFPDGWTANECSETRSSRSKRPSSATLSKRSRAKVSATRTRSAAD